MARKLINDYVDNLGSGKPLTEKELADYESSKVKQNNNTLNDGTLNDVTQSGASMLSNYNDYVNQIKMNKMNARSEVANAQQRSNMLMNNYLKALGIQGSGLGQSAIASNNLNYANMQNQSDMAYDEQLRQYNQNQADRYSQIAENLVNSGVSTEQLQNFRNSIPSELDINSYLDALGSLTKSEADVAKEQAESEKNDLLYAIQENLSQEGLSNGDYKKLKKYQEIIYEQDSSSEEYKKAVEALDRYEQGMSTEEIDKELGIKSFTDYIKDYANAVAEKNNIAEKNPNINTTKNTTTKTNEPKYNVDTVVDKNNALYSAYSQKKKDLQYQQANGVSMNDNIVMVEYEGKKYYIDIKTDKITSVK